MPDPLTPNPAPAPNSSVTSQPLLADNPVVTTNPAPAPDPPLVPSAPVTSPNPVTSPESVVPLDPIVPVAPTPPSSAPNNNSPNKSFLKHTLPLIIIITTIVLLVLGAIIYLSQTNWSNLISYQFDPPSEITFPNERSDTRVTYRANFTLANRSAFFAFRGRYEVRIRDANHKLDPYVTIDQGPVYISEGRTAEFLVLGEVGYIPSLRSLDITATGKEELELVIFSGDRELISVTHPLIFKTANLDDELSVTVKVDESEVKNIPSTYSRLNYTISFTNSLNADIPLSYSAYIVQNGQTVGGDYLNTYKTITAPAGITKNITETYLFSSRPLMMDYDQIMTAQVQVKVTLDATGEEKYYYSPPFTVRTAAYPY